MRVIVVEDQAELAMRGADAVIAAMAERPSPSIVPATGNTPMDLYRELAARRRQGQVDTSQWRVFQLDAYLGVSRDDPRSLFGWMKKSFLDPLEIPQSHAVGFDACDPNPLAACRRYDAAVREAGGFDLAVLGLGLNGHLGFNEPPSPPDAPTREIALAPESIASGASYWGSDEVVPRRALTAGMSLLLSARKVVLLVSGARKAKILRQVIVEAPTPLLPASYLQRVPGADILCDSHAAAELTRVREFTDCG